MNESSIPLESTHSRYECMYDLKTAPHVCLLTKSLLPISVCMTVPVYDMEDYSQGIGLHLRTGLRVVDVSDVVAITRVM